jgi:RNA 3'-terminal phosphate cyclase-like protein
VPQREVPLVACNMAAAKPKDSVLRFHGAYYLRHRLVLATLAGRTARFDQIRDEDDVEPGLSPAEISFVRLLDKITNGSAIEINETGTTLRYKPGLLIGQAAARMTHDCHPSRPIGYYVEPLLMLAPFCKRPLDITLRGPTHGPSDVNIDSVAAVSIPLLRRLTLGTPLSPEIVVLRRAAASSPDTYGGGRGGSAIFKCDVLRSKIAPIELVDAGVVKRVRGVAFANRVSPSHITQMVDGVRSVLNRFTPDVYVHTDHTNSVDGGAGYGIHLVAETTEGCLLGADWAAIDTSQTPGLIAKRALSMLLEQIAHGGCVDSQNACLAMLMCALADSDVNRIRIGHLTDAMVSFMRDLKSVFGVMFQVKVDDVSSDISGDEEEGDAERLLQADKSSDLCSNGIILSCVGVGLSNLARQRF